MGDDLAELRSTKTLLCPFVKNGHEYNITVLVTDNYQNTERYSTNAIAGGGIYLTNNPFLKFTNGNETLSLSEMPTFSDEVLFSEASLFDYSIYVRVDPEWIMNRGDHIGGGGERTNELNSDFVQSTISAIKDGVAEEYSFTLTGELPIFGMAHCLLNYGNKEWIVAVAISNDVIAAF
jgi:hypothetical protein